LRILTRDKTEDIKSYQNKSGDVSFLVEILKERFKQHIVYLI